MNTQQQEYKGYDREEVYEALLEHGFDSKAKRYRLCKEDKLIIHCQDCGSIDFYKKTCQLRICEKCSGIQWSRVMKKYLPHMEAMNNPIRLDVTIRNTEEIERSDLERIRENFYELVKERFPQIEGGIYSLEVKHKGNGYNIHIHSIIDSPYLPQQQVSEEWEDISGDPVVYIKRAPASKKALGYITKYITKPPQLENTDQLMAYLGATENFRMLSTFGSLYNVNVADIDTECKECGSTNLECWGSVSYWSSDKFSSSRNTGDPHQRPLFTHA